MKNHLAKKHIIKISLLICFIFLQITVKSQSYNVERIHTHVQKNMYIAGEAVWYKIYCLNDKTKKLSDISNVAYIELINEDGNSINQQSIILKNGMGSGGFALSENLPTGNYAINAYTHWIKSISSDLVNVTQIFVFNSNRIEETSSSDSLTQTVKPLIISDLSVDENQKTSKDTIKTETRKEIKIPFQLSDFTDQTDTLYLSASLKLKEPKNINHSYNINHLYRADSTLKTSYNVTPQRYAENKSYILEGKLIEKKSKLPIPNSLVYLSKIGAHADIAPYITKNDGSFFFRLPLKSGLHDIAIQYGNKKNQELAKKQLNNENTFNYIKTVFSKFYTYADIAPYIKKEKGDLFFKLPIKNESQNIDIKDENKENKELEEQKTNILPKEKSAKLTLKDENKKNQEPEDQKINVLLKEKFTNTGIAPKKWNKKLLNKKTLNHIKTIWENYNIGKLYKQTTFNKHKDTTLYKSEHSFFGVPHTSIKIKDYIKLDSLEEYFHELLPMVKLKYQNNKTIINIYNPNQGILMENTPLLLFDGMIIDDYSEILAKNVDQIQQIDVIPFEYFYRSAHFHGIIHIISNNKKCELSSLPPNTERHYLSLFTKKIEFAKHHKLSTKNNIPDFRTDLLWEPDIEISKNKNYQIKFHSGDVKGQYELIIQGISAKGKPIYYNKKIIIQ